MAIFRRRQEEDDLQWLEEALLAEEEEEDWDEEDYGEDCDEDYGDEYDEEYDDGEFEEEDEDELSPGYNYAVDSARTLYADQVYGEVNGVVAEGKRRKKKKKRSDLRGLKFLAWLEIAGILAIIGWWIVWLN